MARYTKSIASNHLLEVGLEGFYGDSSPEKKQYNPGYQVGTDYITNNLVPEIDFATIHAYPDAWYMSSYTRCNTSCTISIYAPYHMPLTTI